ncbi:MAG: biotin/lipoyl-binding protein, partial [Pseudomonadales bacterium]|nr:biotin/lipoyl-binding protein [Pseudomonadales bacterium]
MTSLHSLCFIPLGLILALAGCALDGDAPVALGTLEVDRINVTAESAEPIVEVLVTEGDTVAAGDPLVRQDPERIRVQLKKAEADLAVAKAKLDQAEAGPRAQDIAAARAQLSGSQSDVKTARIELEREQSLVKQNYASQNNVDILEGRLEVAIAKREAAQATLDQLLEGTRSEEIDAARSSYSMAQTLVDDIDISLARTTLKAPVDGQVEAVLKELGERPYAGSTVVIIAASQAPY